MNTNQNEIILYQPDNSVELEVVLENETVWLSLDKMAELFLKNKSTISRHIKNVFEEKELDKSSTVAIFATVQMEGKKKNDIFALVNIKINYVKIRRNKIIICAI